MLYYGADKNVNLLQVPNRDHNSWHLGNHTVVFRGDNMKVLAWVYIINTRKFITALYFFHVNNNNWGHTFCSSNSDGYIVVDIFYAYLGGYMSLMALIQRPDIFKVIYNILTSFVFFIDSVVVLNWAINNSVVVLDIELYNITQ